MKKTMRHMLILVLILTILPVYPVQAAVKYPGTYAPVFDTLEKIKLLQPLIYKRCSSLGSSFNI